MYGTIPDGWLSIEPHEPTEAEPYYDTVTYEAPLAPIDIYRFELLPAAYSLPLYQHGTKVRSLASGKVGEIEFFDGVYLGIRDEVLSSIQDWLVYEPVKETT